MATTKTRTKARPKARTKPKVRAKVSRKAPIGRGRGLDLGKYVDELSIGGYSWDDVLASSHKNVEAIAAANRAVIDGYTDIARRQYQMLRDLLRQLRKVRGDRDEVVKELKKLLERARKDLQILQKEATRTNAKVQGIVKRRAEANLKAWKKMAAEVRASIGGKRPAAAKPQAKKKAAARKKPAARKKAAPKS